MYYKLFSSGLAEVMIFFLKIKNQIFLFKSDFLFFFLQKMVFFGAVERLIILIALIARLIILIAR